MQLALPSMNKRRSRRLRKKLHIGEFKELGFEINFRYKAGLTQDEQIDVLMKFITEAIETKALAFGGGENGYITRTGRGSSTEADREAISSWLHACQHLEGIQVGELEDAWYGGAASDA